MILVTVGTNEAPFDRLLEAVGLLGESEPVTVQHGSSRVRPQNATCVPYMSFDELAAAARQARIVVTHAGVGSVLTALSAGRRPVVLPRLRRYGEAVDDHQLELAERLARDGVVVLIRTPEELPAAVIRAGSVEVELAPDPRLLAELRDYLGRHARSGAFYSM
jgi:UDP-N-acetylglucosamine--N-acetylmuramyl-(pentapeptide) pyrophosphoryl-undecaprenol N-acetylglucosamine transferase